VDVVSNRQRAARDAYDRPLTPAGADLLARRHGYRLASLGPGMPGFGDRFLATFLPEPDDGTTALIADGRTQSRALSRGVEMCRRFAAVRARPKEHRR
jgi:hypothetical protein